MKQDAIQINRVIQRFKRLPGLPSLIVLLFLARQAMAADGPAILWSRHLAVSIDTSPALDAQGNIYVTCAGPTNYSDFSGGKLVAVSPRGKVLWEVKIFSDIKSSPAIGVGGNIYFGARDRKFYAVSAQGSRLWNYETGDWIDSSAAIATDGTLYFGGWDRKFHALTPDGGKKWEFPTGGPIDSSPAVAPDGTVYFGSHDGNFYALNPDGTKKWSFGAGGAIISAPALTHDGSICFTSVDGNLYLLDSRGAEKWRLKTGGIRSSSPVIDAGGNIFLGVNNILQCVNAQGVKKWWFGYPTIDGAAALSADGLVYCPIAGDGVGTLLTFHTSGGDPTYRTLGSATAASAAIADDGTIYTCASGNLIALKGVAGLAKGCWPKFRGDSAQTGRLNSQ